MPGGGRDAQGWDGDASPRFDCPEAERGRGARVEERVEGRYPAQSESPDKHSDM
jgi:hypothetical protein